MTARPRTKLEKGEDESLTMGVSLESYLLPGETVASITGHDVVALDDDEEEAGALDIDNVQPSGQVELFDGLEVAAGRAILWSCEGGTAGFTYRLFIAFLTSTGDTKDARIEITVTEANGIA